jgi:YD repeat-containing protein
VYALGNNGNIESVNITNKRGIESVQRYDELGNMIALQQSGKSYTYNYDNNNNLIKVTKPKGNITQNSFDNKGNLLSQCQKISASDVGICQSFVYDSHNNLTQNTDALGNITSIEYNTSNKVTKITAGNRIQSFEYNASGSLVKSIDAKNNATNYEYDVQGNVTKITNRNVSRKSTFC